MAPENLIPEKQIGEFVTRLRQAAEPNLESLILYGSAVSGEYDPEYSNINLLCVLKDTALPKLLALAPSVKWWTKQSHSAPLLITRPELERSADVFAIEFTDMQRHHRVLFGSDPVASLQIPMQLHRAQLEYELREKLILLRQRLLLSASDERRTWDLILRSLPSFTTLFRHALIAQEQPVPATQRAAVQALAANLSFDASPFEHLLDIREHRADPKRFLVQEVAGRYLAAVEQVTAAVDRMLDSPEPRRS
ncbi:MAG TPA: nucleotidyltransferase domain-containing protein [Terriglobales bacterium]|nr:nucleotidyltransferase domain-containing protein [Terriglobales bacterium]